MCAESSPADTARIKELEGEVKKLNKELEMEKQATQLKIDKAVSDERARMEAEVKKAFKEGSDYVKDLYMELKA